MIPQENQSSGFARLGTAAHTLGEKCLETGCDPIDYLGVAIKVEGEKFIVDGHMVDNVTVYVEACREQVALTKATFQAIEFNSELGHLFGGEDVGGPCDFVCLGSGVLVIGDYKNGTHPVEIEGNTQFFKYGLGMYEELKAENEIHTIRLIVIQPRCHHEDGPVRSKDYTVKELLRWKRKDLRPAIRRVQKVTTLIADGVPIDDMPEELRPHADSEWCHFCPINGVCGEYAKFNKQVIQSDFGKHDKLSLPAPNTLTVEEAEAIVSARSSITKWLEEVYNYRKHALSNGDKSEKFKIVESKGNRALKNERRAIRKLKRLVPESDLFKSELHGPATLEKVLYHYVKAQDNNFTHKDAKEFIDTLCFRPARGNAMVPIKDGRQSSLITASDDFAKDIKTAKTRKKR